MEIQNISEKQKKNRERLPWIISYLRESTKIDTKIINIFENELKQKEPFKKFKESNNKEDRGKLKRLNHLILRLTESRKDSIWKSYCEYLKSENKKMEELEIDKFDNDRYLIETSFIINYFWPGDWWTDTNTKQISVELKETLIEKYSIN